MSGASRARAAAGEDFHDSVRNATDTPAPKPKWRRCRELVDVIIARASEAWVQLALGGEQIVRVRPGGIVLLIGGTGRGKSSLAVSFLVEHAKGGAPALACSLELPADEWSARGIGTQCDASWASVLQGEVKREWMIDALPEGLYIIDRSDANMGELSRALAALRAENPEAPIMVAVDYVQLVGVDSDEDIRPRIGKVMRELDIIAREHRVVMIALSQGSRASSKAMANDPNMLGAATTDAGAESADLERWATATLAIGAHGELAADGSCTADLSIGKSRMGGGDRVVPARYHGKSGLWRMTGEGRPASQVRDERRAVRDEAKVDAAKLAMVAFATKSREPLTHEALREAAAAKRDVSKLAISQLLEDGDLVEVRVKRPKAKTWQLWTPDKAAAAGVSTV